MLNRADGYAEVLNGLKAYPTARDRKIGSELRILCSAGYGYFERIPKMAASLENVLGGKEASLALLQVLADNSFDAVVITDASLEGKITYANKAFKRLTGYDQSEVIGKTPRILQGAGTDKKVIERLAGALKAGGRFEGRAINYRKDGTPFIMWWKVLPIKVGKAIKAWVAIQREGSVI